MFMVLCKAFYAILWG